jgi:hypothetical protein
MHNKMSRSGVDSLLPQLLEPARGICHVHADLMDRERRVQYLQPISQPAVGVVERLVGAGRRHIHNHAHARADSATAAGAMLFNV